MVLTIFYPTIFKYWHGAISSIIFVWTKVMISWNLKKPHVKGGDIGTYDFFLFLNNYTLSQSVFDGRFMSAKFYDLIT